MNKKFSETQEAYFLRNGFLKKFWNFHLEEKKKKFVKRNLNTDLFFSSYKGC